MIATTLSSLLLLSVLVEGNLHFGTSSSRTALFGGSNVRLYYSKDSLYARSLATLSSPTLSGGGSGGGGGGSSFSDASATTTADNEDVPENDNQETNIDNEDTTAVARGGGAVLSKTAEETEVKPTTSDSTTTTTDAAPTTPEVARDSAKTTTTAVSSSEDNSSAGKSSRFRLPFRRTRSHKCIAKKLKNRNHTNLRRKVVHATFGIFFASLNHFFPKEDFVPAMAILSVSTLVMELLRYRKGFHWINDILHITLGSTLRKHEMDGKFTGSFYFFTGVTLTAALYPRECATLGICQLALADPSASYFGRQTRHIYWSRIENGFFGFGRNKGLLGFLGGALFCVPFNYRVLSIANYAAKKGVSAAPGGRTAILIASFGLGIAGAFADLAVPSPALVMPKKILGVRVPPFHVDDNFIVPIFSGYAATKIFEYLKWSELSPELQLAKFILI